MASEIAGRFRDSGGAEGDVETYQGRFGGAWIAGGICCVLWAWPGALRGQEDLDAELKKTLGQLASEMQRVQDYLTYQDQLLQLQVALGEMTPQDARAQLGGKAGELYERSFGDAQLRQVLAQHKDKAGAFLDLVGRKIEEGPGRAADPSFREIARERIAALREVLGSGKPTPATGERALVQANETGCRAEGLDGVPPERDFFSGSRSRAIAALPPSPLRDEALRTDSRPVAGGATAPFMPMPDAAPPAPMLPGMANTGKPAFDAARKFLSEGNVPAAYQILAPAWQQYPDDTMIGTEYARVCYLMGRLPEAVTAYQGIQNKHPELGGLRSSCGYILIWFSQAADTLRLTELDIREFPNLAWPHLVAATALFAQNRQDLALPEFRQAATLDPGLANERFAEGRLLYNTGQDRLAGGALLEAWYLQPANPAPLFWCGLASARAGQIPSAVAYFQQYLQHDAASPWAEKARQEISRLTTLQQGPGGMPQ